MRRFAFCFEALTVALVVTGCQVGDKFEETYRDEEMAAEASERRFVSAMWNPDGIAEPSALIRPAPFAGMEDITFWVEVPHATFHRTAVFEGLGDPYDYEGPPEAKARLHIQSASGRFDETVTGTLVVSNPDVLVASRVYAFSGVVGALAGEARSYDPRIRPRSKREFEFKVRFWKNGTSPLLSVVARVQDSDLHDEYVLLGNEI